MAVRQINVQTGEVTDREYTPEEISSFASGASQVHVPQSVSMRQARLILLSIGKLQDVQNAINSIQGAQGEAARIEWEYSSEVRRNQPLFLSLAPILNMTPAQLDKLFIDAAKL